MSRITKTDAYGLMEAYNSIYTLSEEQIEIEELGISIVENAANVLFSQGYNVNDLCDYFEKASTEVISEDYLNFAEGQTYISESFIVSDEYVQEQFNLLEDILGASEMLSEAGYMASQRQKLAAQRAANPNPVPKSTPIPSPAKPKVPSSPSQKVTPPSNSRVTSSSNPSNSRVTSSSNRVTSNYSVPASQMGPKLPPKPGFLQKASNFAKGLMSKAKDVVKKIPGAGTASKIAKSPIGKFAGKVGSRVLPGVGVVAYGADAAKRFKKGDWGGGLLSTAGAVTSAIPGAGLVAGLAPAGIQMATDAMGLTGDKSKKGSKIVGPKIVGPKIVGPKIVGPKSSSPSGGGGSNASGGGGGSSTPPPGSSKPKPNASTPAKPSTGETDMQKWAKANPTLAAKVRPGQSGYSEISAIRDKPSSYEKQDQTPTQGSQTAQIDTKSVDDAIKAEQERQKKRLEQQNKTPMTAKESYEPYDIVLNYLLSEGHADTLDEANYIMLEMDETAIGTIMEQYEDYLLAEEIQEWVNGLVEEGYDLSQYTWDDMVEYYVSEARVDAGKTDDEKIKARSERGTVGYMHPLTRGDKKKKGRKDLSSTGIHGKYSQMQYDKRAARKDKENTEYNERQRVQSRGTWDKD